MEELKEEIRERGSFDVLTKEIERIVTRRKEEEALFEECTAMKETAMELRQTLANEKMSNEAERTRLRNILLDLKVLCQNKEKVLSYDIHPLETPPPFFPMLVRMKMRN